MNTTSLFKCVTCSNRYLTLSVEQSAIYALCGECGTMHKFDTTSGKPTLTFTTLTLAPQQEPAVQVPATAPAAGHLTELTVYCPACDFSGATATQHAPDSLDHNITCSNCGFDGDRNKITLVS